MKEIRHYSINQKQKSENDKNSNIKVSQIVKEYNERIINYFYSLKDFNLQTSSLSIHNIIILK